MRATRAYILLAALLMSACATEPEVPELGPVGYAPVVSSASSSGGGCNIYPTSEPFVVCVRSLEEEQHWATNADESQSFIDSEEVSWNGSLWTTAEEHIWPWESSLSLMAYSPATAQGAFSVRSGVEFDNIDILSDGNDQLMFANPVCDQLFTFNNGVINIPFVSALAELSFAVIPHVPDDVEVVVKRIAVSNIQHRGSFCSLPEASWAPTGDSYEVCFFEGEESVMGSDYKQLGTTHKVMPQSVMARVEVVCDFHAHDSVIPNQVFVVDEKMIWRVGKTYLYTIKIYMDSIGFMHDVIFEQFD